MIRSIRTLLAIAVTLTWGYSAAAEEEEAIKAMMQRQVAAWNAGDITGFMDGYWNSDALTFSSGGRTTRGWKPTLDRYQTRYDTREKMGQLTFSDLEITPLGSDHAFVLGRWNLAKGDPMEGNFTLVMKRNADEWVIIHDHTSLLQDS